MLFLEPPGELPRGINAVFTTRVGGVSRGPFATLNLATHVDDDPADVEENRQRLSAALALPSTPCWLNQVHGNRVALAGDADASYTRTKGKVLCIQVADCVPILAWSDEGEEIAAIHAGWRGLHEGVIAAALGRFRSSQVTAWIGPHIRQCHYEVGQDVADFFQASHDSAFQPSTSAGHWMMSLSMIVRQQLIEAGVRDIRETSECTSCDAGRYFSFRRDGTCGRMAALIWRNSAETRINGNGT